MDGNHFYLSQLSEERVIDKFPTNGNSGGAKIYSRTSKLVFQNDNIEITHLWVPFRVSATNYLGSGQALLLLNDI